MMNESVHDPVSMSTMSITTNVSLARVIGNRRIHNRRSWPGAALISANWATLAQGGLDKAGVDRCQASCSMIKSFRALFAS